jgi:hypothetical protein
MKFSLKNTLTFSALLALSAAVFAAPLQDISVTSIDLAENTYNKQGDEHLFVTVTRIDDLVDDDGSLLAERIMAVRVTFDVEENQLMCNGKPVEIGVSNIQVEAQMAANPSKLSITTEEDAALLADSFDIGLVTVEVTATILDELKTDDGMVFRRLSVQELITEVNGQKVIQTEAGQQILDIFDNGSLIKWSIDPLTGFMLPGPAVMEDNDDFNIVGCPGCDDFSTVDNWWNEAPAIARSVVGFSIFAVFASICYLITRLFTSQSSAYEQVSTDDKPPAYAEKEEKQPFLVQEEQ